jgi:hypothetical protein
MYIYFIDYIFIITTKEEPSDIFVHEDESQNLNSRNKKDRISCPYRGSSLGHLIHRSYSLLTKLP